MQSEPTYSSGERQAGPYDLPGQAIDEYNSRVHPGNLYLREDISRVFGDFASTKIHYYAQSAAELADLFDRLNDPVTSTNVRRALMVFNADTNRLEDSQYTHGEYIRSIAYDFPIINDFVSERLNEWRDDLAATPEGQAAAYALNANNTHMPNQSVYLSEMPYDMDQLDKFADTVNIETILIKSSQILNSLRNEDTRRSLSPTDLLRVIAAVEGVYAPLCKSLGFQILAAALTDTIEQIRFRLAGRDDLVEKALEIKDTCGTLRDIEAEVPTVLNSLCGEFISEAVIHNGVGQHDLLFHEGILATADPSVNHSVKVRLKSTGSIAKKLHLYETKDTYSVEDIPADIIGIKIIVPKDASVGSVIASTFAAIDRNPNSSLTVSPGRDKPVHVKGSAAFMNSVMQDSAEVIGKDAFDKHEKDGDFMYAKITFSWDYTDSTGMVHTLPIEIQCMDETADIADSRGEDSHLNHKSRRYSMHGATTSGKDALENLYQRGGKVDAHKLTIKPRSYRRMVDAERAFSSSSASKIGGAAYAGQWLT